MIVNNIVCLIFFNLIFILIWVSFFYLKNFAIKWKINFSKNTVNKSAADEITLNNMRNHCLIIWVRLILEWVRFPSKKLFKRLSNS